jgi:hypothetical protein
MKGLPSIRGRKAAGKVRAALKRANAHTTSVGGSPTHVQLLGQVSGYDDWPRIREYWTRRSGLTGGWPARLGPNQLALNLWPTPPGQLQLTTGVGLKPENRQPRKVLSTPALLRFDGTESTADDALAHAIASWVSEMIAENEYPSGVQLAPPILEEWARKGQLVSRRVITYDLDWDLPPAENIRWPPSAGH